MKKYKYIVAFSLLTSIVILSSFTTLTKDDGDNNNEEPTWRNVQVLPQNLSHEDMDAIMDAWSNSLGVSCSYCHAKGDKSSDEKEEKIVARKMLVMTNEINEKYFGKDSGTISCMTCHNGKTHP
ncbi:MAG: c-type cytochrome [Chitinophagales bacterium]|nr:c-type cytochrome [Bacteroidota bacterium]